MKRQPKLKERFSYKIRRKDPAIKNTTYFYLRGMNLGALALLVFSTISLFSQNTFTPSKKFTPEQLKNDFNFLYESLKEAHPGFTRYRSEDYLKQKFDSTFSLLNSPMNEREFYKVISPWVASVGCGHTNLFMPRGYRQQSNKSDRFFPFGIRIIDSSVYIIDNYSIDSTIARGTKLISINGRPIWSILNEILPALPSDGYIMSYKIREVEDDFLYHYSIHIGQPEIFNLTLQPNDGGHRLSRIVPALKIEDIVNISDQRYGHLKFDTLKPLRFEIDSSHIATLTIRSFDAGDIKNADQNFKRFLKRKFRTLRKEKIEDLVIDLRFNVGGNDNYGRYLYALIAKEKFKYYKEIRTASDKKPDFISLTNRGFFFSTIYWLSGKKDEKFLWRKNGCCRYIKPHRLAFPGKVVVLINGESFSATTEFASVAHYNKRAVFVGEETGGAYEGNNSGTDMILPLPETKIRVSIPVLSYYSAVESPLPGRGIIPHHPVKKTIQDILSRRDAEKEFAKELLINSRCKGCGR